MKVLNLFKFNKNKGKDIKKNLCYSHTMDLPKKNEEDIKMLKEEIEALNILYEKYRVSHSKIFIALGISIFIIILLSIFILYLLIHHFKIL